MYLISSADSSIIRIFLQINILEGRACYVVVLLGCISVNVSYSFHCLTTETVKYIKSQIELYSIEIGWISCQSLDAELLFFDCFEGGNGSVEG